MAIDFKIYWYFRNDSVDYWLKGKVFDDQQFLAPASRPS